jgi:VanZ family protein
MTRLKPWLAVLLWAVVIFTFSTNVFSSDNTSRIILPILHWLFPRTNPDGLEALHAMIRKSGHIFEYFVLGVLLFRAVRAPARGWNLRWAASALFLAALFAASDEFHQAFVPSRGSSVWDVLLDTCAAAVAQLLLWLWERRRTAVDRSSIAS